MAGGNGKQRDDPYLAYQFRVTIRGIGVAGFSEVSGLDFESDIETFRQGGGRLHEEQLVGNTKFPSRLVLKRGMTDGTDLWDWHQDITQGRVVRKDVTIQLLDSTGAVKRTWKFLEAAPVKWVGPQFRGAASEIAVETLELVHRGFQNG